MKRAVVTSLLSVLTYKVLLGMGKCQLGSASHGHVLSGGNCQLDSTSRGLDSFLVAIGLHRDVDSIS